MSQIESRQLLSVGAWSGAVWFLLAMLFDKGGRDFNVPVIPSDGLIPLAASLLGGVATGIVVTFALRRAWLTRSRVLLLMAPLAALVLAIITFSLTTWLVWLVVGELSRLGPLGQLQQVLGTFAIYGLMSLFTPILYLLAHLNQFVVRRVLTTRNLTSA